MSKPFYQCIVVLNEEEEQIKQALKAKGIGNKAIFKAGLEKLTEEVLNG